MTNRPIDFGPPPGSARLAWEEGRARGRLDAEKEARAQRIGNVVGTIVFVLVLALFGAFDATHVDDGRSDVTFRVVWGGRTYFVVKLMPEGEP